jgi:hypothetical protein
MTWESLWSKRNGHVSLGVCGVKSNFIRMIDVAAALRVRLIYRYCGYQVDAVIEC